LATQKPTLYVDSNIISSLHYRGRNEEVRVRSIATRNWWSLERPNFNVWGSRFLLEELERGAYSGQEQSVNEAIKLPFLVFNSSVKTTIPLLLQHRLVPESKPGDAVHLAIAIAQQMDYLMSWNYAHITNPETQSRLDHFCATKGWRVPFLVSPDTIPKAAFGQNIRRMK